jgi:tetratricopeptide (TPR) repeat protein
VTNEYTGLIHYYSGRYDEAIDALHRTIEMDPDFIYAHGVLGLSYLEKSMYDEAITEIQAEVSVSERLIPSVKCWLGHAYARADKTDEARTILDALLEQSKHTSVSTYFLANLCFALGEHDHGFTLLDEAYEDRDFFLVFLKVDPLSEPIRSDLRYEVMLKKIGLDT